ncbi:MAG: Gluconate 2-dehydrogenase gamma chain [Tardiphaga sp.]|nr:Gluconate 2-dehydrogenase gamma chain [Tardiphaga sp.]
MMIDGSRPSRLTRRFFLVSTAALLVAGSAARARTVTGGMPWEPGTASPPIQVRAGPWAFFTPDEAATVEAAVDRLIPPDERCPGGKDAGCAVYIDRQLAGAYGKSSALYMQPPFMIGQATQGYQAQDAPAARYRNGLKALADYVKATFAGKSFSALSPAEQDQVLTGLDTGKIALANVKSAEFFALLLQNTQEGFFADPAYGGNKDMAGWKLVGFPGTRYDYRDWVERHNEVYPLPPVSIMGRPEWTVKD